MGKPTKPSRMWPNLLDLLLLGLFVLALLTNLMPQGQDFNGTIVSNQP